MNDENGFIFNDTVFFYGMSAAADAEALISIGKELKEIFFGQDNRHVTRC